jgi:hypothetical protein
MIKIKQAKEYYELGVLTGFDAVRDPLKPGAWLLVVSGKDGRSWTMNTALNKVKSFASLDTLIDEIESITGRVGSLHVSI